MIWHAAGPNLADLVYRREHLTEPIHTLEILLEPNVRNFWTVRARFTVDGKTKVTEWSKRSVSASLLFKIFSKGVLKTFTFEPFKGYPQSSPESIEYKASAHVGLWTHRKRVLLHRLSGAEHHDPV